MRHAVNADGTSCLRRVNIRFAADIDTNVTGASEEYEVSGCKLGTGYGASYANL